MLSNDDYMSFLYDPIYGFNESAFDSSDLGFQGDLT